MMQYSFSYVTYHEESESAIKNSNFCRKILVFQRFLMSSKFFDLQYHVVWRSCTVKVEHIVPMKNYETHVLISLRVCYNFKGRILKKTL